MMEAKLVDGKLIVSLTDGVLNWGGSYGIAETNAIRAALGYDLTEEQVEVARLEAELEQAREEGFLLHLEYHSPSTFNQPTNSKKHSITLYNKVDVPHLCEGDTKVEMLRKAVAELTTLRKPKLPDVDLMNLSDVSAELRELGYECTVETSVYPSLAWQNTRRDEAFTQGTQTPAQFHRDCLREARERAANT